MLVFPERLCSKYVPDCNRFHAKLVDGSRNRAFLTGVHKFEDSLNL